MGASLGDDAALPRWFRAIFVPIAGVLLVLFFLLRGFPYDAISDRITMMVEPAIGARLQIAELGPSFAWTGPGLEAVGVRAVFHTGQTLDVDRISVHPSWSAAWFRGGAAFYLELDGPSGAAMGSIELGEQPTVEGSISNFDLSQLSFIDAISSGGVSGRMDATFALALSELGAAGPLSFEVRAGSVTLPNMPIALPFEKLTGDFELGGDATLSIGSLKLEGPIASGSGSGTIAKAPSLDQASLRMEFDLNVKPALAGGARKAGLRVGRNGNTKVRVTGTVSNPRIR